MPIDASIISNMQQPDFSSTITNGLNMRGLAQQNQMRGLQAQQAQREFADATALRNAQNNNVKVGPDGNITYDTAGTLKDLASTAPHLVPQLQAQMAQQGREMQSARLKTAQDQNEYIARLAGGATDQPSWDKAIQQAGAAGIDTSQVPKQFDPNIRNSIIASAMAPKDLSEAQYKQQDLGVKQQELGIKSQDLALQRQKYSGENVQQTLTALQSAKGNPMVAKAENDVYADSKVNKLAQEAGDPKNLNMTQVRLLAAEVGKIASGNTPTMDELHGLTPNSVPQAISEVAEKFNNTPTAANAQNFVKSLQSYSNSVAGEARKVLKQNYQGVIETKKPWLPADSYKTLNEQFIGRLNGTTEPGSDWSVPGGGSPAKATGKTASATPAAHPQDSAAVQWAQLNMKDPRAQKILQLNGIVPGVASK